MLLEVERGGASDDGSSSGSGESGESGDGVGSGDGGEGGGDGVGSGGVGSCTDEEMLIQHMFAQSRVQSRIFASYARVIRDEEGADV